MIKVAHVCTNGYNHKMLVDKLRLLQSKGYEIHLISDEEGYNEELLSQYPFKLRFVPMVRPISPWADLVSIIKLIGLFRRERYQVVHTHTAKAGILGRVAARLAGVPAILHTHHGLTFYQGQSSLKYYLYRLFEKTGAWFGHAVGSQNEEDLQRIREFAGNRLVFYEGNGVDLNHLDQLDQEISQEQLAQIRRELSIPSESKVLVMGARLEPVKNHRLLIESLHKLVEGGTRDFVCLIVGDGVLKDQIAEQIAGLGLGDWVRLVGYKTNIYPYLKLADVVVLTSEKEGIPRILMEAMSFRKPVVATDVSGTRELVRPGENGFLAPYPDSTAIALCLKELLADDIKRRQFGASGRELVEEQFTEAKVVERLDRLYHSLL